MLANKCPRNMPCNEGSYATKIPSLLQNKWTFTDVCGIRTPTLWLQTQVFLPYEPILLGMGAVWRRTIQITSVLPDSRSRMADLVPLSSKPSWPGSFATPPTPDGGLNPHCVWGPKTPFPFAQKTRGDFLTENSLFQDEEKWEFLDTELRGPAAILFISRDAHSDSIAKLFHAWFYGGIAQLSRDMLQNGVSHRCACVKTKHKGGGGYRTILGDLEMYRPIWVSHRYGATETPKPSRPANGGLGHCLGSGESQCKLCSAPPQLAYAMSCSILGCLPLTTIPPDYGIDYGWRFTP